MATGVVAGTRQIVATVQPDGGGMTAVYATDAGFYSARRGADAGWTVAPLSGCGAPLFGAQPVALFSDGGAPRVLYDESGQAVRFHVGGQ